MQSLDSPDVSMIPELEIENTIGSGSTLDLTYTYSGWMDSNSYTTNFTDAGTHTVTVTVSDGEDQDSQDVTVRVLNKNRSPLLGPIADITKNEGETITISPTATDPDVDDTLAYTYTGWMTSKSYTTNYTDAGTHTVNVTVSDDEDQDSQIVTVRVLNKNRSPVLGPISPITVDEGQPVTIPQTGTDLDVDDTLEYTYTGWMTSKSYTANYTDAGTHTVNVTVSDDEDQDSQDVTITVLDRNGPPLLGSIADITKNEGETITISPTATDPDGDDLTYTYSGWMTSNSYTTNFTDAGTHTVTVTVKDGEEGHKDSKVVTVRVLNKNRPPLLGSIADITKNEGETITISPTATDPDGDVLTYTYSGWMDSDSYTTNFTDAGTHLVTVTVSDGALTDSTASQDVTITVNNVNQPPVLGSIADITKNEGETITISPTATDPDFTSDQVTLEWDPNPESELVDGYKIYSGTSERNYDILNDDVDNKVGNKTSYTIQDLEEGQTYYIAVKAYGTSGNLSDYSAEVVYTVPTLDGIIDNGDSETSYTGGWVLSSSSNPYGFEFSFSATSQVPLILFKLLRLTTPMRYHCGGLIIITDVSVFR